MALALSDHGARSWIYQAYLFVFACGGKKTAISIPAHRLNRIVVTCDDAYGLGLFQIPQDYLKVRARAQHYIFGGGVPLDLTDASLMPMQIDDPIVEILVQAVVAYLPHFYGRVFGARGYFVVVERIPFEVEHGTTVSAHFGRVYVNATGVLYWNDYERTAAALFGDDGHKFRVDGAKGGVVRGIFRYFYVLVADIFFVGISVYVSVF